MSRSEGAADAMFPSARVLVVDDSPFMGELMVAMLNAFGVGRARVVSSGGRALEALSGETRFNAVILDWLMEPVTGMELLAALRENNDMHMRRLPVVACTAYSDRPRVEALRDAGVDEVLTKPVAPRALYHRMEAALIRRRDFIDTPTYVGPDRRRRRKVIGFPDRRTSLDAVIL